MYPLQNYPLQNLQEKSVYPTYKSLIRYGYLFAENNMYIILPTLNNVTIQFSSK